MRRSIKYIFLVILLVYNTYTLSKYRNKIIKLEKENKTMLNSCKESNIDDIELERYK